MMHIVITIPKNPIRNPSCILRINNIPVKHTYTNAIPRNNPALSITLIIIYSLPVSMNIGAIKNA